MPRGASPRAALRRLNARVRALEAAIRRHRRATGQQMCWENDEELWAALKDGGRLDHTPPPWPEFMRRCALYRASKDRARRRP